MTCIVNNQVIEDIFVDKNVDVFVDIYGGFPQDPTSRVILRHSILGMTLV